MATLGLESTLRIEEWDLRINTLRHYLTVLRNNLGIFGFTQERIRELQDDIKRSLVSMEGRHKTISEALRTPSNEVRKIKEESARRYLI